MHAPQRLGEIRRLRGIILDVRMEASVSKEETKVTTPRNPNHCAVYLQSQRWLSAHSTGDVIDLKRSLEDNLQWTLSRARLALRAARWF